MVLHLNVWSYTIAKILEMKVSFNKNVDFYGQVCMNIYLQKQSSGGVL